MVEPPGHGTPLATAIPLYIPLRGEKRHFFLLVTLPTPNQVWSHVL